jgi:NADH dehydrogenase [ubiquinone] 1 alpha subcomplex assembly factor 7
MMTPKPSDGSAPIPLDTFMRRAIGHYYAHATPFGAAGDFITAPDISQIFGELIGLWLANTWQRIGSPAPFTLLELGPGRGTLMADALRTIARVMPTCLQAMQLNLLESSAALREQQSAQLATYKPIFIDSIGALPPQPLLLIANEFFDALPVAQYRCRAGGWQQRAVLPIAADTYKWAELPVATSNVPNYVCEYAPPDWMEYSADSIGIMHSITTHISSHGGAALVADYGYAGPAAGDTVQALRHHQSHDVLHDVGQADITAHVDFTALAQAAGPLPCTLIPQGEFLHALGGRERLATLCANADSATQAELRSAYNRLTDPAHMGTLFKVLLVNN